MEDSHSSTEATSTATPPPAPAPAGTPAPEHQTPVGQTREVAKKLLAMITGRAKR